MARRDLNQRITPQTTENYQIQPVATPVDKMEKFAPDLSSAARTKAKYEAIAQFGKGLLDVNTVLEREAQEHAIAAYDKTAEKNRKDWAEVSKNFEGMEKFNPYNKDAYHKLVSAEITRKYVNNLYADPDLASKTPEQVANFVENNQQDLLAELKATGLKQKDYAQYLVNYSNRAYTLKQQHIKDNAEIEFKITKNTFSESLGDDMATALMNGNNLADAALNAEKAMDSLGWTGVTKAEVIAKGVQAYIAKNPEASSVDVEDFMQTYKINGKPFSSYIPNATVQMQNYVRQIKRAQFDDAKLELDVEKLRLEKETLNANAEMFKLMSNPNATDEQILAKANELIANGDMQTIGFQFLNSVVSDKNILLNLRTTTTNPKTNEALMQKYITGDLTQNDIITAFNNKQLSATDAHSFFNNLQSTAREDYQEQLTALKELYLDNNPVIDLGDENKANLTKSVYQEVISNPNLNKQQKAEALRRIKGVAEYMDSEKKMIESKDPTKLLTKEYMKTQQAHNQTNEEAHRYLAKMGFFRRSNAWKVDDFKVSSPMQAQRTVTLSDGTKQTSKHNGTDVTTYLGRQIVAPKNGRVIASGYEKSMGNYVLFECDGNKGYIKLMHLQYAQLPKAGTQIYEGFPLARVGNTGNVTTKDGVGILHIECFNSKMKLIDPKQFMTGKA